MKKSSLAILLVFSWFSLTGELCTKEIVTAKDYTTQPYKAYFKTSKQNTAETITKVLKAQGFEIISGDTSGSKIVTGWRPVKSDSHYYNFFGRKDYGLTDGAYYQVMVDFFDQTAETKVLISTKVKTITGKLNSSGNLERSILTKAADHLRSPQIEITNVGVKEK